MKLLMAYMGATLGSLYAVRAFVEETFYCYRCHTSHASFYARTAIKMPLIDYLKAYLFIPFPPLHIPLCCSAQPCSCLSCIRQSRRAVCLYT